MDEPSADIEVPPAKKQKLDDTKRKQEDNEDTKYTLFNSNYSNYITSDKLEQLKEFKVLDEVRGQDDDSNDGDSDSSDDKSEGIPAEDIEKMLEEDLPDDYKGAPKPKEKPYVCREKVVLDEKGMNHFEILPLDWTMVRHYSGMPVYVHRGTRVCTLSKPYFIGKGNARRHDIPITAIPCLAYRRAMEEEEKQKEIDKRIEEQIRNGTWSQLVQDNANNSNKVTIDNTNRKEYRNENTIDARKVNESDSTKSNKTNEILTNGDDSVNKNANNNSASKCPFSKSKTQTGKPDAFDVLTYKNNDKKTDIEPSKNLTDGHQTQHNSALKCLLSKNTSQTDKEDNSDVQTDNAFNEIITNGDNSMNENEISNIASKCPFSKDVTQSDKPEGVDIQTDKNNDKKSDTNSNVPLPLNIQPVVLPGGIVMPPPKVETVSTSWKTQLLTHEQVNEYCKKLFCFKTVNIMLFKRWADRRKYTKARKALHYPTLPEGTKLITIPVQPNAGTENGGKPMKRDWVMNMDGRSYLSVFHEYVRRALQKQPVYEFKQLENASSPYQATVYIGGMQYGVGLGTSKRQAKSAAARASIHVLIPEMRDELDALAGHPHPAPSSSALAAGAASLTHNANPDPDFTFFDNVGIEDPRITEFCAATCEPSPHAILRTCLLRNFGDGDRHIQTEMKKLEYHKVQLTMKVGKHTSTVVCKNQKTAKQRASQAILQALHPHVRSWGSLLRLYGSRSVKSRKEKKLEEQQITLLQDKARRNEPNYAVLEKLRTEMKKLREKDESVMPIRTMFVMDDLPTHSASNLNNVDL